MTLDDWKWIGIFSASWLGMMIWIIWKAVHDENMVEDSDSPVDDQEL